MTFTILIPAYREYEKLLVNVPHLAAKYEGKAKIIIMENGSQVAPQFDYLDCVETVGIMTKGLGAALRAGLYEAKTDCVVFLPADLSYDLRFVDLAVPIIEEGKWWSLIIGSKAVSPPRDIQRPLYRKYMSDFYNGFYNIRYKLNVRDITGVKAYKRKEVVPLLASCQADGIRFEVQLINEMRNRGMGILEVPVKVRDFRRSAFVPWQKS